MKSRYQLKFIDMGWRQGLVERGNIVAEQLLKCGLKHWHLIQRSPPEIWIVRDSLPGACRGEGPEACPIFY